MIIGIHDNLLVSEVQDRFNKCFPSLKIEFYSKSHSLAEESKEKHLISPSKRIGEIRQNKNEGFMEIKSWDSVARIEKEFHKHYGLNIQVFRNENGSWVQTSVTDRYSLAQQNQMADHARSSISPKFREQLGEYDYL